MKKYLIKEAKKSLSLFLAVLMLMSCWVWVAPEKAEAANITPAEKYTVTVGWTVTTRNTTGGSIQYKTVSDRGWGTESGLQTEISSFTSDLHTQGQHTYEFTTTDFPTNIKLRTINGKNGTVNDGKTTVDYVKINGVTVYHGGETWSGDNSANIYPTYDVGGNFGTTGMTKEDGCTGTFTWPKPMIAGFLDTKATEKTPEIDITLNKIGQANVEDSTNYDISKYECYDQYGVAITDEAAYIRDGKIAKITSTTTYVSDSNNSDDPTEYAADIWSKGNEDQTVVVSPNLQISNPQGSNGTDTFYLVRKYVVENVPDSTIVSKVSAKVNVTYPKYDVTFDAGLDSATIPHGSETSTGTYTTSGYNAGSIVVPDNKSTSASGYTFLGYWSEEQPSKGNASYNAATAVFAQPCTTEDFESYKKMSGAKLSENGTIVTVTEDGVEKSYCNAGVAMDPTTAKTIDVSENYANFRGKWCGWWIAKDLSVKFYDVDGSFLGEKLVKAGQTHNDIEWPKSKYIDSGYTSGAFKFKVDGNIWENTDGTEINKNSYTFTKDLILTPKLTEKFFTDKYAVSFIYPHNGNSITVGSQGGSYDYRQNIDSIATEALGKINVAPADFGADLAYSYELLGWSSVKPTTGKNYHVLLEDADFDENGTAISTNSDWVVRNEATYYAVYRRHVKTYVVDFLYMDATGADATRQLKVKYGANLVPPTDYVPYTYVTKGFGYTFDKWTYKTDSGDATLGYSATIPFTSENIQIAGAALDDGADVEPIVINATYGTPVATPYTVTFNYVDDKGEDVSQSVQVRNEQFILDTTVDTLTPAEKWDHEDNLYTYAGKWEITEGSATEGLNGAVKTVGDTIDTAALITLTPTSNLTFKAVYADPIPFYTVTYIDGLNTFTDRVLQGSNVPGWTNKVTNDNGEVEDKIYVPADYEGEGGTYVFQGWYDQKQNDDEYKQTNGNKVTTADKVTGNLTLYSQFKFVPFTYTIKFMNHDGTVQLGAGVYEKGQNIEALVAGATKAAQTREADDTYTYVFLGWDKEVPTFCEGYDVTYTALYKPVYRYYDVKWYNSKLVDGKWVADKSTSGVDGETVETNLLATTHHTFNSKLYTPSVDNLTCLETAPAGQNYVFAGWYYNDADGNAVKYERGMLVTAKMEFYATYTLSTKVHTVTAVVRGVETKYTVADGSTVDIPEPQAGWKNETHHDAFDGWYTDVDCTDVFDEETQITADTTLYAKFTESEHELTGEELVSAPTYYKSGEMAKWCSCDREKTEVKEEIAKLTDTVKPTGTIYLGDKSWSSTGEAANATDNEDISIFVNEDTDIIITANDTGDVNALYNPAGLGIGVRYIRAFAFPADTVLTADNYGAAQSLAVDVYVDETQTLTNNANFAIKLGNLVVADLGENGEVQYDEDNNIKYKKLESGEGYIVYYYVVDKAGNQLNTKVRTAKFIYDNVAPTFEVTGSNNEAVIPTYCGSATVTDLEKDVVLTVNGTVVDVTYAEGEETGTYEIEYAEDLDNVLITATDKAGNTYSKKIKIADHSYVTTEKKASCGVAGYKKEECIICGDVKTNETYDALEHVWTDRTVIPADCVNNGKIVVKCEICGEEVVTELEEDGVTPAIPALGHKFAKNDEGEIIYDTVTESTCKTQGLGEAYCIECNGELEGGYITTKLALNTANHEDITITEVAPDCTHHGYYTKACSCGVIIEHKDHETDSDTYAAKGHGETTWEVITEATCYQPGTMVGKCSVCTVIVVEESAYGYTEDADGTYAYVTETSGEGEEATEVKVTEEIDGKIYYKYYLVPATGEHVKTVTNPDTYKEDGYVYYHCATEGCLYKYEPKKYVDDSLEEYTVTFVEEDGTTVIETLTVTEGSAIAKDAVTAPDKAETAEYKYTFAGWLELITDKDGKVTEGSTYKLPLAPERDMTLKATYKETKRAYTHQFVVPTTWTDTLAAEGNTKVYTTLVGTYGTERVPSSIPVFEHENPAKDAELKKLYTFEFKGWKNAMGELVTDFTVVGDATFTAYFEAVSKTYDVIYYDGDNAGICMRPVNAGAAAGTVLYEIDEEGNKVLDEEGKEVVITPEKESDETNHYTFTGTWYTDATRENEYKGEAVIGTIRLYAGFDATEHTFDIVYKDENGKDLTWDATCTEAGQKTVKCACGYVKTTAIEALGHSFTVTLEADRTLEDGTVLKAGTKLCARFDECGAYELPEVQKYTVTLKDSATYEGEEVSASTLGTETVVEGAAFEFTAPKKASTEEYTYRFVSWTDADGNEVCTTEKLTVATVDANAEYTANYVAAKRQYTVSYLNADSQIYMQLTVEYGAELPAVPATAPEKAPIDTYHYVFKEWIVTEGVENGKVVANVLVKADFIPEAHEYVATGEVIGATCTQPGGVVKKCSCGKTTTTGDGADALGHSFTKEIQTFLSCLMCETIKRL